jgi:hypothetical protein
LIPRRVIVEDGQRLLDMRVKSKLDAIGTITIQLQFVCNIRPGGTGRGFQASQWFDPVSEKALKGDVKSHHTR